jgi:2-polyprenyl-3-methyl-5-hydroxy-6-metoxy-1,4-benzoquinol methylase
MILKKCRLCNSKKLFKFLDLGSHPPSDQFKQKAELNNSTTYYPLQVFSCNFCGFKQLNYVVDPKILYQQNYPYESSLTNEVKKHFSEFALSTIQEYKLRKNDLIVDIGSNTGVLLSAFKKNKLKIMGIDPASNMCKIAIKRGIPTINNFFNKSSAQKTLSKCGKAKVITGSNVFAHVNNLRLFMKNIKNLLHKKQGIFVIEVPHFLHLIKNLEYDTIYHEHLSYISVKPLVSFLKKFSLEIIDVQQRDIHGGSIRIFISGVRNYKVKKSVAKICKMENKAKLNSKKILINFQKRVIQNRIQLTALLTKLKKMKKKIIILSAPAKGMTLINYCKIDKDYIDFATEKSSIKQNLYTPGGNIPIYSDDKILKSMPDYALLLAWNFSKEIVNNNIEYLKKGGKFIIPIPNIKIISHKKK